MIDNMDTLQPIKLDAIDAIKDSTKHSERVERFEEYIGIKDDIKDDIDMQTALWRRVVRRDKRCHKVINMDPSHACFCDVCVPLPDRRKDCERAWLLLYPDYSYDTSFPDSNGTGEAIHDYLVHIGTLPKSLPSDMLGKHKKIIFWLAADSFVVTKNTHNNMRDIISEQCYGGYCYGTTFIYDKVKDVYVEDVCLAHVIVEPSITGPCTQDKSWAEKWLNSSD